jgi:hypothetical protein
MVLVQKSVRRFGNSTKMTPTAELSITLDPMGNTYKNLLLRNHWANCNQTLVEWSLGGPFPKLCPVILTFNQDGHQAKSRKRGDDFGLSLSIILTLLSVYFSSAHWWGIMSLLRLLILRQWPIVFAILALFMQYRTAHLTWNGNGFYPGVGSFFRMQRYCF